MIANGLYGTVFGQEGQWKFLLKASNKVCKGIRDQELVTFTLFKASIQNSYKKSILLLIRYCNLIEVVLLLQSFPELRDTRITRIRATRSFSFDSS